MKIFLILLSLFACTQSKAQLLLTFDTQNSIDNFSINYPGVTEIDDVNIKGEVQNLLGLSNVTKINSLSITAPKLKNLHGLENITKLNFLDINSSDSLLNLEGLNGLKYIKWDLTIGSDGSTIHTELITSLKGLTSLDSIGRKLAIVNTKIKDLKAISNVKKIGSILIAGCDSLANLEGINITSINSLTIGEAIGHWGVWQDSIIFSNALLTDFKGLENLTKIQSLKVISKNINSFNGLQNVTQIGAIKIGGTKLTNFEGLDNLIELNDLYVGFTFVKWNEFPFYFQDQISSNETFVKLGSKINSFSGLGNITQLSNLKLQECNDLEDFTGLESLVKIKQGLTIGATSAYNKNGNCYGYSYNTGLTGNENLKSFKGLENLKSISSIIINNNTLLKDFYNLESLKQLYHLNIHSTVMDSIVGLNHIEEIANIILRGKFKSLSGLDFGSINNLTLTKLEMPSFVGLGNNPNGIEAFHVNNIKIEQNNYLTDISAIGKLPFFGSLSISNNKSLKYLDGLGQLSTMSNLLLFNNPKLQNLDGLIGLDSITELHLGRTVQNCICCPPYNKGNNNLNNIQGINNITVDSMSILGNESLALCEAFPVCKLLEQNKVVIADNAAGCNSKIEVDASCSQWSISGKVFYDYNQNKIKDSYEGGLDNHSILLNPNEQILLSDVNGNFRKIGVEGTNYTLSLIDNPDWDLTTDSISYNTLFEAGNPNNNNKDFGLHPNFSLHSASCNLSSYAPRCNKDVQFFLHYSNDGTFVENGKVKLEFDDSVKFVSATPLPDIIDLDNHILVWNYEDFYPANSHDIELLFTLPSVNAIGQQIFFTTSMLSNAQNDLLAEYSYDPIVLCSFDPNDKQVMPIGDRDEHFTLQDKKLTYTVRFQNTGNAEAIDITILDTIDTNLDLSTLRIVNSSFPVQTSIQDRAVSFFFQNIWLPDSTSNEPDSHGFITYEIQPLSGLADFSKIKNTAYIIFDANKPIITNTTFNTMVSQIPVGLNELLNQPVKIYPNPASKVITIQTASKQHISRLKIFNQLGQLVLSANKKTVDVTSLTEGLYFVHVEVDGAIQQLKLVIQ